ncbi:DUF262 domain-containing protein [Agromyces sp. NPDC057865]|uniref:DUF262 domain-containing protein n=1 Tax=Agromyces sp. NPDC057865 TaxID=3346267 RepID=UPI00366BB219
MATHSQVEASTISVGAFFAERRLIVPDYQRKYSWTPDEQIDEFWRDLSTAIGRGEYFLGLVILADGKGRTEVVDGQQRLVTLTILANELRLIALRLGRRLVAESVRTDFLDSMDYETEEQIPRILLTDPGDHADLRVLLAADGASVTPMRNGSAIHAARLALASRLSADIDGHEQPALRVGQWTEFLTKSLTFAVFTHPDRNAAFRVYEVVNTRGKDLTPTELIKSHLIGSSATRESTYRRWSAIESQLESLGAAEQLTTFVRHVVTLERGYVIPRELYQEVSTNYTGPLGVEKLLGLLEHFLPRYLQMIDPSADVESSEATTRSFAIADALSIARFRPVLLVAAFSDNPDGNLVGLMDILIPAAVTGRLGSGSYEAQFARAARRLHQSGDWSSEMARLGELKPPRDEFELRLSRGINKAQAHVLRSARVKGDALPDLVGYPHQVRPRNGEDWVDFDGDQYKEVGGLLANWVLSTIERRPQGTRTPEAVEAKLLSTLIPGESISTNDLRDWTAQRVKADSAAMATDVAELWYGAA